MKMLSWEEIKKHNIPNDCWIVANNYVYDATEFIKLHPGGQQSIIRKAAFDYSKSVTIENILTDAIK